jgi:mono/diheme cytochrome c family protein
MRRACVVGLVLLSLAPLGCARGRKSSAGFRLPDGDPVRGKAVFVANRCNACHTVAGESLPAPVAQPPVPVELGGRVAVAVTDGELVTSIVYPSHRLAGWVRPAEVRSGELSRMGDFTEAMSVRDLIDLVAYLQSRYTVVPPAYHRW